MPVDEDGNAPTNHAILQAINRVRSRMFERQLAAGGRGTFFIDDMYADRASRKAQDAAIRKAAKGGDFYLGWQ